MKTVILQGHLTRNVTNYILRPKRSYRKVAHYLFEKSFQKYFVEAK